MKRRTFLGVLGTSLIFPYARGDEKQSSADSASTHPLASFDQAMKDFMRERDVPGGALAVVKNQKLIYARGYGWADREKKLPAKPDSLFRIASITKPFTAVAILQMVERGKLKLEERAFDLIHPKAILADGEKPDPRLAQITINHLLHHTGGWDRDKSYDPMFRTKIIAQAAGVAEPPNPEAIIRYMLGQSLDFDPGKQYAYSNFGYCVLGRVIEKLSGKSYENFVKESVLSPVGIKKMRIGSSRKTFPGEVRYYRPNDGTSESVFAAIKGKVPSPYGGFNLEAMDSHGAWIASAVDLARFAAALNRPQDCPILQPETFARMYAPPAPPVSRDESGKLKPTYYACGWMVRPVGENRKANYWHNGSLPGTATMLVRRADGLSWAVLFNQRSEGKGNDNAIDGALHRAAEAVKEWPEKDLFAEFES